jgi:hypothetical protein
MWQHLENEDSRRAVELTEQYAEGLVTREVFNRGCYAAQEVMFEREGGLGWKAAWVASWNSAWDAASGVSRWAEWDWLGDEMADRLLLEQASVLRCIVGNPFRPVVLDPRSLTPAVTSLAVAVYVERALPSGELDHERLAILSDALEETGCTDARLLTHLREPGKHVRGCWVIDALLGKQ